ncbi:MAG: hypothetical protein E7206_26590 [Clostridium beijerinckii]|jgi:hypothetical protein|nr:hypothetical protein [Clostridium beijerinckii]
MDLVLRDGLFEMTNEEASNINGGFIVAIVAIGASTYAITSGMVVGAVTTAWAVGTVGYQIYNAFK